MCSTCLLMYRFEWYCSNNEVKNDVLNASSTFSNVLVRSGLQNHSISGIPLFLNELRQLFLAGQHTLRVFQFDFDAENLVHRQQNAFISHCDCAGHRSLLKQQQAAVVQHLEELSAENGVVCAVYQVKIQSFVWIGLGFFFRRKFGSQRRRFHAFGMETTWNWVAVSTQKRNRMIANHRSELW